ncbi:hypothetical protein [Pseudomonas sp. TH31]|uniref:hypothetical protein n=1 Tax=Pseudomonas sp. TH31 TaxID=2796396 RepID=UPI001913A572|nr:hypothetical protein [Pseudomonas sp. TH31]MBK5416164.1 hypothetical protein [Pseudomonas sp. TH31]
MTINKSTGRWVLGHTLVVSTIIAGSVAFTMQAKVKEVKGVCLGELHSELDRAKDREVLLGAVESMLLKSGATRINNGLEMYSIIQEVRQITKDALLLAKAQQTLIELQVKELNKDG